MDGASILTIFSVQSEYILRQHLQAHDMLVVSPVAPTGAHTPRGTALSLSIARYGGRGGVEWRSGVGKKYAPLP